jgi:putative transposase
MWTSADRTGRCLWFRPNPDGRPIPTSGFGWFGRWSRLSKDYAALPEVSEAMSALAAIRLMVQRLAHPNRRRLPAS